MFPYLRREEELFCFLLTRQVYFWNVEFLQTFAFKFVINKLRFWAKFFLLGNAEFTKPPLLGEWTGVVNNPSTKKLNYSKWRNAVLNPSKSFLALKKVNPRILSPFKRSFSKKMEKKKPSSNIIHSLGGKYRWIVRDSEPIRLLKSPEDHWVCIY